jgi:hypothetical protein
MWQGLTDFEVILSQSGGSTTRRRLRLMKLIWVSMGDRNEDVLAMNQNITGWLCVTKDFGLVNDNPILHDWSKMAEK